MNETVVIALPRFCREAKRVAEFLVAEYREYHQDLFSEVFPNARRIVAVMSIGIVVRKCAPLLKDKWNDPAVVVVSPDLKFAIPLIGGHHGANALVKELTALGMVPVITTATETAGRSSVESIAEENGYDIVNRSSTREVNAALLDRDLKVHAISGPAIVLAGPEVSILVKKGEYVIGIGCQRGVGKDEVTAAFRSACADAGIDLSEVMICATTMKKAVEAGLLEGISAIPANLIFLDDETINAQVISTPSKAGKIGLLGVAEPCALAVAKRKELVMKKQVYGRVTIAIAR